MLDRAETERAFAAARARGEKVGAHMSIGFDAEVYMVREAVWKASGMAPFGGCLCIGCLEKRLGRKLRPKDFLKDHVFNGMPASPRLMKRQKRTTALGQKTSDAMNKKRDRPPHMTVGSLKQFLTDIAETDGLSDDALVCFQSTEHGLQSVHGITLGEARIRGIMLYKAGILFC